MSPTLIIVPGLGNSGPEHWQSLWERKFGGVRVMQTDWDNPAPHSWAAALNATIEATPGEVVLIGHSCGVLAIVHYAALYPVSEQVRGAMLVAPTDAEQPDMLEAVRPMAPVPMQPLPFPALVVASENDPYASFERAEAFAAAWDAELVTVGEAGHINISSGHGQWEEGEILLSEALYAWTPPAVTRF